MARSIVSRFIGSAPSRSGRGVYMSGRSPSRRRFVTAQRTLANPYAMTESGRSGTSTHPGSGFEYGMVGPAATG
jgi:hypothetical protein